MEHGKEVDDFIKLFEDYRKDEQSYYENMIKKVSEVIGENQGGKTNGENKKS